MRDLIICHEKSNRIDCDLETNFSMGLSDEFPTSMHMSPQPPIILPDFNLKSYKWPQHIKNYCNFIKKFDKKYWHALKQKLAKKQFLCLYKEEK